MSYPSLLTKDPSDPNRLQRLLSPFVGGCFNSVAPIHQITRLGIYPVGRLPT